MVLPKVFPTTNNQIFTTLLENPIELIGKFQVALVEISNFSNFNIEMGTISFKNPFFGDIYENRDETISFNFLIENGCDLKNFCSKLNFEIQNHFIKHEFLYRQKLAFEKDETLIQKIQLINDRKVTLKKPILNVLKKGPKKYEILEKNDSIFGSIFLKGGGYFDNQNSRFKFVSIDFLKSMFILVIIRVPESMKDHGKRYNQIY